MTTLVLDGQEATWGGAEELIPLLVPTELLDEMEGNPNLGDTVAVAHSYRAFGQQKPIVVRKKGRSKRYTVIAGNTQLRAARELGWSHIAVVTSKMTDEEAAAFALADNRTAELGTTDNQALLDLIEQVNDEAMRNATGYSQEYVDNLIQLLTPKTTIANPDDVPTPLGPTITVEDDLWLLGQHRLICGDSTDYAILATLMEDQADMVWTDPPYGVEYVGKTKDQLTIENDDFDVDGLYELLRGVFVNAMEYCVDGGAWFVAAPAGPQFLQFARVLTELGVWRQTLVWEKNSMVMGRSDYHYRHEALLYGWKPGAAHTPPPDRKQDTVWAIDRPSRSLEHPTMKPVELIQKALANHCRFGGVVLDPFAGSGSTMIACHQEGAAARMVELDPHYCDVICLRYQLATGDKPVHASTGNPVDFNKGAA